MLAERINKIIEDFNNKTETTYKNLNKKRSDFIDKMEDKNRRLMEKNDYIKILERQKMFNTEKLRNSINEKYKKIAYLKDQKNLINEKKREVRDDIIRKKREYDAQFSKMFHKKDLDAKMIYKIQSMFPDNEKIKNLLARIVELEKEKQEDLQKQSETNKQFDLIIKQIREGTFQQNYEEEDNDDKNTEINKNDKDVNKESNKKESSNKKKVVIKKEVVIRKILKKKIILKLKIKIKII